MIKNKLNSNSVEPGDWQAYLVDRNLTPQQRFQKIKESAQVLENKALRMEY